MTIYMNSNSPNKPQFFKIFFNNIIVHETRPQMYGFVDKDIIKNYLPANNFV